MSKGLRIISISNQKGGVGKTTTAVNLGTALAAVGKKVLLIDLDPQGNASTSMGIPSNQREINIYQMLIGQLSILDVIKNTCVPNLDILPSGIDLAGAELELIDVDEREFCLKKSLARESINYDFILIDCPPSLGLLTLNALVASGGILVPLQVEFLALEGLSQLVKTIERIKNSYNNLLEIQGIVLTMADKRNKLSEMVEKDVRKFFGAKVYKTVIPRNVTISEAPSHGKPVLIYDLQSRGAKSYLNLASEVLKREKVI
ncbi:MAG: ParA family protein [Pseudomonadota bacterium]|nr:ParA family protein [Pseudomonadota bacterium]